MKKHVFSTIALLLATIMLLGSFASCAKNAPTGGSDTAAGTSAETEGTKGTLPEDESKPESESKPAGESNTETKAPGTDSTETEAPDTSETETSKPNTDKEGELEAEHSALINYTNSLSNGVQAYFSNSKRTHFNLQNAEMTMSYARAASYDQLVAYISNTKGNKYVENTMDIFLTLGDGNTYYASQSAYSAEANLYRFGFYYYEALFEFQDFVPEDYDVSGQSEIKMNKFSPNRTHNVTRGASEDKKVQFTIADADDPYFVLDNFSFDVTQNDTLILTAKSIGGCTGGEIFISTNNKAFNQGQSMSFALLDDGEYHTYYISLSSIPNYEGNLNALRFDLSGGVGSGIVIDKLMIGKAELTNIPDGIKINRHFHVYTDKMHHAVQFAATKTTTDIAEVGMLTKINADTVASIVILDAKGKHTALSDVDWESAYAVAFDIKNAGIFGFILPVHEAAGKISVALEDGVYVIKQTRTPTDGTINPSIAEKLNDLGNYVHADGVKNNGNDFYLAQRIYTDENHTFDEFLFEAYCERNPLTDKNIRINTTASDGAAFKGYDPIRGIYTLSSISPSGGFFTPYNVPNKNYRTNFNVVALKEDRDFYIMVTAGGLLECSALMTKDMLMLPIPIEVIKNFSEDTGERNLFNIDDPSFGEAIFCITAKAGEKYEYNLLHLYQNWGKFPLKQLSQIPFHCPYYHLSTGVTETNCILPWFGTSAVGKGGAGNTLPDFRSMSAPFWQGQPQHNSCGSHKWLQYTDSEGGYYAVENTTNTITSFGPTYAELVMDHITDDGRMKVTYTHMEMPQTDENRTYYTMEYEILEDFTIEDFRHNFQFYNVTDNNSKGSYKKIGYLDENNECQVIDATQDKEVDIEKVLGDQCPYFSFFMMPDWNRESDSAEGYSNVSFMVYNSKFVIGGKEATPNFYMINEKNFVTVTLDLDKAEFKAGDKLTVNAIIMPWGSQKYEDGIIDLTESPANYEYTMDLGNGELYMDKNVRDVRENTLLNPLTITSTTDEIMDSPFVPKVRSKDGKTVEFTLSGGANNAAVRAYGFDMLTAPKVQELVDGKWVDYNLSSSETPDKSGFYHYYDGYAVHYEGDGKYSYSFVVEMKGEPRTFRLAADTEFDKWPREFLPEANEDFLKVYTDPDEIKGATNLAPNMYGETIVSDDGKFVSVHINPEQKAEAYSTYYTAASDPAETGQYFVIMYRVPKTNTEALGYAQIWSRTEEGSLGKGDSFSLIPKADGEWHIEVYDLSTMLSNFKAAADEKYYAKTMRVDIFNQQYTNPDTYIDIAFIGMDSDLKAICDIEMVKDNFKTINLNDKNGTKQISVETGEEYVVSYIDPSSGYTQADVTFGSIIDSINNAPVTLNSYRRKGVISIYSGASVNSQMQIVMAGWAVVDGGVNKYVWSADGGKTWNDCIGNDTLGEATDEMIKNAASGTAGFEDATGAAKNGKFQASNGALVIDLQQYEGMQVDVIIAAVTEKDTNSLCLLYCLEQVNCSLDSIFADGSAYLESYKAHGSTLDYVNGVATPRESSSQLGFSTVEVTAKADNTLMISGWSAVDSGVTKYLWTADNGATWNDCNMGHVSAGTDDIISYGQKLSGSTFTDPEKSKKNGRYQGDSTGVIMDLSAYAGSTEPIELYFTALPQEETNRVVIIYKFIVTMP